MQPFERILVVLLAIFCFYVIYISIKNLIKPKVDVTINHTNIINKETKKTENE